MSFFFADHLLDIAKLPIQLSRQPSLKRRYHVAKRLREGIAQLTQSTFESTLKGNLKYC